MQPSKSWHYQAVRMTALTVHVYIFLLVKPWF